MEWEILDKVPMEVAVYSTKGNYTFVNRQYVPDGDLAREIIGRDDEYLFRLLGIDVESARMRRDNFNKALTEKRTVRFTEKLHFKAKDKIVYYKRFFQPVFAENGEDIKAVTLFGSNITAIIHAQQELKYIAHHDKLTGLHNRDAFNEQLDQIILEAERDPLNRLTAIIFCDLDNFTLVNDSLGHDAGDKVLREAAQRMKDTLRKSDQIFRLGGDEFVCLAKNIRNDLDASRIAMKLIEALSSPYYFSGAKISYLSNSVGIVLFPRDGKDRDTLVKRADMAMYTAKKEGKNGYRFFSQKLNDESQNRLKLERDLHDLVNNCSFDNHLRVFYQPIVERSLKGGFKIIGSEALLRWQNPEMGLIPPKVFIPIAEENNLIEPIGEWVFYQSCKEFRKLAEEFNYPLYVSVNFSAKQLHSKNLIPGIEKIIAEFNVSPENLQFELTETSYLVDDKMVAANLKQIEELGIRIAIDDFGVGFASLVYLLKVPATVIKIDRSFISRLTTNRRHRDLVKSIIILGKNLNKEVIAEGVEKMEQVDFLKEQQCDKYQGYLFSKPMPFGDYRKLLQKDKEIHMIIS